MKNKFISSALVISLVLSFNACNNPPLLTVNKAPLSESNNTFETKDIKVPYLERKFQKWVYTNDSDKAIKDISYARIKSPAIIEDLMLSNHSLFTQINSMPQVQAKRASDPAFNEFMILLSGVPLVAPAVSSATNVTSGSFRANWNTTARATGYTVVVTNTATSVSTQYLTGNVTNYTVTGLAAATNYSYKVRVTNTVGSGPDSVPVAVTTTAASGIITLVAGNLTPGSAGDNGPATSAQLNNPYDVAVDTAGNIYIADSDNNVIRKINPSGIISVFAGNGTACPTTTAACGDGTAATSGLLNSPRGVAYYGGSIYIADYLNHRIRKVDSSGNLSTVAGTGSAGFNADNIAATSANLFWPQDIDFDNQGNMYIADTTNQRIRKVDTSGIITTIAGTGAEGATGDNGAATSAKISYPYKAVPDNLGNIYLVDTGNAKIRKIDNSGIITTVAGGGTLFGDNGPATSAMLNNSQSMVLDSAGNIYISDSSNNRIRKVDTSGIITTIAGSTGGYNGDNIPATSSRLNVPVGITFDSSGNLLIADRGNHLIRKISN